MTILVTGATGTVGRLLLPHLVNRGANIRVLTRNPLARLPGEVSIVVGDLTQPDTLAPAFLGVTRLFLLSDGENLAEKDQNAVLAAKSAGVKHIVKLSVLSARYRSADPITQWHMSGEAAVRNSGMSWTLLRPNGFMSNALNWSHSLHAEGKIYAPYISARTSLIDPADIAEVAAIALSDRGHAGKCYHLTGPEALSIKEQAAILSLELGKTISVMEMSPEAASDRFRRFGMSPALATAVCAMLASALDPRNSAIFSDIERVTRRPACSFKTWVSRNLDTFRSPLVEPR